MELQRRLYVLTLLILFLLGGGVAGFWILGRFEGHEPTLIESLYQTVITLATVGNKTPFLADVWYGQLFIIVLVMSGMGILLVFATTVTAFFVEGEMRHIYRRKRMDKVLSYIQNHFVVCGAGDTGAHVIEELLAIRDDDGKHFLYNPPPEHVLEVGTTLIVLGPTASVQKIRTAT